MPSFFSLSLSLERTLIDFISSEMRLIKNLITFRVVAPPRVWYYAAADVKGRRRRQSALRGDGYIGEPADEITGQREIEKKRHSERREPTRNFVSYAHCVHVCVRAEF